ncbi:MAG: hypothetical protein DCC55_03840, partial [Chloroflexi bacterium]
MTDQQRLHHLTIYLLWLIVLIALSTAAIPSPGLRQADPQAQAEELLAAGQRLFQQDEIAP